MDQRDEIENEAIEQDAAEQTDATISADSDGSEAPLTPLTGGPPRLLSLISTAAAALILLTAIAITVLSWPDWVGEVVRSNGQ